MQHTEEITSSAVLQMNERNISTSNRLKFPFMTVFVLQCGWLCSGITLETYVFI